MQSFPTKLLAATLFLSSTAQAASSVRDQEYIHGYAQGVMDHDFPSLKAQTRSGKQPGQIIVSVPSCLDAEKRVAISKALIGDIVQQVELDMPCPSTPLTGDGRLPQTEVKPAEAAAQSPAGKSTIKEIAKEIQVEPLPATPVFRGLLADPREPRFAMSVQRQHTGDEHFSAVDLSVGGSFGLAEGDYRGSHYQIGLQGAVFAVFDLDSSSFDLLNADYWLGLPLTWRNGEWSGRARLYHQSSHLGDEFLLNHPGFDRVNLSYEAIDTLFSREWTHLRLYGGGGVIVHSEPNLNPGMLQLGAEYLVGTVFDGLDLTLASDFKASDEQDWNVNQSYRAGFTFTHLNRDIRLLLEYYRGYSPNGQFFIDRLDYTGIGLYFGF